MGVAWSPVRAFEFEHHELSLAVAANNAMFDSSEGQYVPFPETFQHDLMRVWHVAGMHWLSRPLTEAAPNLNGATVTGPRPLHNLGFPTPISARYAHAVKGAATGRCATGG